MPRLLRATFKSLVPFSIPSQSSLTSWTPEGGKLPPIFVPQTDPAAVAAPDTIALFGSADAPSTVLRIANRRGLCSGGPKDRQTCATDTDCPEGSCDPVCGGGANDGAPCATDADCPSGECGRLFDPATFQSLAKTGGPIVLPRALPGICQLPPHAACKKNADCPGGSNPCVS